MDDDSTPADSTSDAPASPDATDPADATDLTDATDPADATVETAAPVVAVEVAELVAERDALREQLETLEHRRTIGQTVRRLAAPVLVILFAMTFLAAGVGVWLHRNTLNDDVWAERVVPLGEDPAVQAALATWTTDELMTLVDPRALFEEALPEQAAILAVPLSAAVRDFVASRVEQFFTSERFEELWAQAAIAAHSAAVSTLRGEKSAITTDDEKVTINLIPLIDAVLNRILDAAPGLVGSDVTLPTVSVDDVPDAARERIATALGVDVDDDFGTITIYDQGALAGAQRFVKIFDQLVVLFVILTVLFAAGALVTSPRRRRTLFQLLGATAIVAILVRRITFVLEDQVADLVKESNVAATRVVVATFADPVTRSAATILWGVALVAVVAAITGPYGWAASLRRTLSGGAESVTGAAGALASTVGERATDPGTAAWVAAHADALRIAGYGVGALLLWFGELSFLSLLLIGLVVAAWQVLLHRVSDSVAAATESAGDGPSDDVGSSDGPAPSAGPTPRPT